MTEVEIFAGICGFTTKVSCEDKGSYKALFNLDSECLNWQKFNELIGGQGYCFCWYKNLTPQSTWRAFYLNPILDKTDLL